MYRDKLLKLEFDFAEKDVLEINVVQFAFGMS
jgi:hypothetical protein